VNENLILTVVH